MLDEYAFTQGMRTLAAAFGREPTEAQIGVYRDATRNIEPEAWGLAIQTLVSTHDGYFPRVAKLLAVCRAVGGERGGWAKKAVGPAPNDPDRCRRLGEMMASRDPDAAEYARDCVAHMAKPDNEKAWDAYNALPEQIRRRG